MRSKVNANRARGVGNDQGEARGGGISLHDGTLTLRSSHVDGNRARGSVGGSGNAVAYGGGVWLNGAGAVLAVGDSTLTGNMATASALGPFVGASAVGGAIAGTFERALITDTAMLRNVVRARTGGASSAFGGAIDASAERVTLVRSTVVGSAVRAQGSMFSVTAGGSVRVTGATVDVDRSRIAGSLVEAVTEDGVGERGRRRAADHRRCR